MSEQVRAQSTGKASATLLVAAEGCGAARRDNSVPTLWAGLCLLGVLVDEQKLLRVDQRPEQILIKLLGAWCFRQKCLECFEFSCGCGSAECRHVDVRNNLSGRPFVLEQLGNAAILVADFAGNDLTVEAMQRLPKTLVRRSFAFADAGPPGLGKRGE